MLAGGANKWLRNRAFYWVVILLATNWPILGSAAKTTDATEKAKQHNKTARTLFNQGEFRAAATYYEKAYQARPLPVFLHNLGQCYKRLDTRADHRRALEYFRRYRAHLDEGSPQRNAVDGEIASIKARLAQPARPRPAAPLKPRPKPELAPTATPISPAVTLQRPLQKTRQRPFYKKWWFWTAVGVVAVGAGSVALALALRSDGPAPIEGTLPPGSFQFE